MSITQKAQLGLSTTAQSFHFFRNHKWLAIFPVISFLISALLFAAIIFGIFEVQSSINIFGLMADATQTAASGHDVSGPEEEKTALLSIVGLSALFLWSVCMYFVSNFFSVALAACTLNIFDNNDKGIWGGISTAAHRLTGIFGWSAIGAIMSVISSVLERRGNMLSSILEFLAGLAWRIATFFVIPILASKNTGAISAIKESVALMRSDWGETSGATRGNPKLLFFLFFIMLAVISMTHINLGPQVSTDILVVAIPLFLFFALFFSTILTITRTALFYYARQGSAPPQFDSESLRNEIARRQHRH